MEAILDGYAQAATPEFVSANEALRPADIYAAVLDLFPSDPCSVADLGAGTGRDAAWLARQGHRVVAAEPVMVLRQAGMALHPEADITWLDDRLPEIERVRARAPFELVLLTGVWQHLNVAARASAMPALFAITAPAGRVLMSLRHGPGAPGRPVFPVSDEGTIALAEEAGFSLLRQVSVPSMQPGNIAAGVTWTWLALCRS